MIPIKGRLRNSLFFLIWLRIYTMNGIGFTKMKKCFQFFVE